MAALSRGRFSWGWLVAVGLVLVPAWKCIEPLLRAGPRVVSSEATRLGRDLFTHHFTEHDPLTGGDGLGPVFNASSCVDCHNQGGVGGGGPADNNVTVFGLARPHPQGLPRSGVIHQHATSAAFQETLKQVHPSLPATSSLPLKNLVRSPEVAITQRNTPALFGHGLIDAVSDDDIIMMQRKSATARALRLKRAGRSEIKGRVGRLADGRIGRFGWKLEFASLDDFVKAACANELGLSNPGRAQATPLGRPEYKNQGIDLSDQQCGLMADFIRALPPPIQAVPTDPDVAALAGTGRSRFLSVGCADCHSETLGLARGLYSDLLLHDMGSGLEGKAGYASGPIEAPPSGDSPNDSDERSPGDWRTAPLWGVADSAPYLHDGRAADLERAIQLHGGEALDVTERFQALSAPEKQSIVAFLKTLRAPRAGGIETGQHNLAAR
jgi:CxxC motif-containing protein (DUF1111 family)